MFKIVITNVFLKISAGFEPQANFGHDYSIFWPKKILRLERFYVYKEGDLSTISIYFPL